MSATIWRGPHLRSAGKATVADASLLDRYNTGQLTPATCSREEGFSREEAQETQKGKECKAFPVYAAFVLFRG
jgi:hypothetical protein